MSVILESLPGDEIICIGEFLASPHGQSFSWETSRKFQIGERVRFAAWYEDKHAPDNPVCWMVLFDAADGKRYAATQTYFVLPECWEGLRKHFARQQRKADSRKNSKTVKLRPSRKRQTVAAALKKRRSA